MSEEIPSRFRVPPWDQYIFHSTIVSDILLRIVVHFAGRADAQRLARAIRLSLDAAPIAGCRYVEGWWRPHYERLRETDWARVWTVVETANPQAELDRFLLEPVDPLDGPLVRARLVRGDTDALCLKVNHLLGDATGCKEYAYLVAGIYRRLGVDPSYHPKPNVRGDRSLRQLTRLLSSREKLRVFRRPDALAASNYAWGLPLASGKLYPPAIVRRHLEPARLDAVIACGKAHGATVNDVLLAAFYRALYRLIRPAPGTPLGLPVAVNMRRYLPGGKAGAICNLSYYTPTQIGPDVGATFDETLARVRDEMNARKDDWAGLGGIQAYVIPITLLPYGVLKRMVDGMARRVIAPASATNHASPPPLNNFGVLETDQLDFGGLPIADAYVTAAVVDAPGVQVVVTSFNKRLTLNVMTRDVGDNLQQIERLLEAFDDELPR